MSLRSEQCKKVCRILDDVLANRPTERDSLIVAVRKAFEALGHLSSTQHNWSPIEDNKLPDNVDVLLQFKSNMGVGYFEDGDWAINTGDEIYSFIGDDEEKPIAWMPLPESYKEGDEE